MLLKDLIKKGTSVLAAAYPEREAREMVLAYLEWAVGVKRYTHLVDPEYKVDTLHCELASEHFLRMAKGEPLQYLTGKADFYGRVFNVDPSVLIPRPETEILCRETLRRIIGRRPKVLDLCTGSGCIAWTIALECPGAEVTAADISDAALNVASSQDFTEEISQTKALAPDFIKKDVLDISNENLLDDRFDVILSNPPYVRDSEKVLMRNNVLDHEPHLALFVPDDDPLKFYRAVADWSCRLLTDHGFGVVEINEALGRETAEVFQERGFRHTIVLKDLSDRDRFVYFAR